MVLKIEYETDPNKRHIFRKYPGLIGVLPWMELASLPTPVSRMDALGERTGIKNLWVKRDDGNSEIYGGNKPRKFEFLLAKAKAMGRKSVATFGGAGSNHGVAVTLFCRKVGLEPILFLSPQPVLSYVRKNIRVNLANAARIVHSFGEAGSLAKALGMYTKARLAGKTPPFMMWFGGSTPTGGIGFVEAAFELADQIRQKQLPEPKVIFVPTGSCGTHAGLEVGLALAGLSTKVVGVRIVDKLVTNKTVVAFHANRIARFLRRLDPSVPRFRLTASKVNLLEGFFGGQYGRPTAKGKEAIRLVDQTEGISLDPTYTGKAFAGLLEFVKQQGLEDAPMLYWHTLNSVDLSDHVAKISDDKIPYALQRYFIKELADPDL